MRKRTLLPSCVFAVTVSLLTGICSANLTLTGNIAGAPPSVKKPCPLQGGLPWECTATLNPTSVQFISSPSQWFRDALEAEYTSADWDFQYMGANSNMNGELDVQKYSAYNDCAGLLGAEIDVNFVADPGSPVSDVLWIQTVRIMKKDGSVLTVVDDKTPPPGVAPPTDPDVMPGPFYPYQDEDRSTGWQSSITYDLFRDKPGFGCPCGDDWVGAYFEVYAGWLYGEFDAAGNVIPHSGETKPTVYIHEGVGWGFENTCVPEPAMLSLLALGALVLLRSRHSGAQHMVIRRRGK